MLSQWLGILIYVGGLGLNIYVSYRIIEWRIGQLEKEHEQDRRSIGSLERKFAAFSGTEDGIKYR